MSIIIKEIKAHCARPEEIEKFLLKNNAKEIGTDHQIDTYFNVSNGRLKLRQGNIESNLIQYQRTEVQGVKNSAVNLFKPVSNTEDLHEVLAASCGIKVVVDKLRKIFFIDNVKFHIDEVKDLGHFVEIEAIGEKGVSDASVLLEQCNHYMEKLGIQKADLVAKSYSDLILEKE